MQNIKTLTSLALKTDETNSEDTLPLMTYICHSSDGRIIPLIPGGSNVPLRRKDIKCYTEKATAYRLEETSLQVQCIREGLTSVIPTPILSLLMGSRLEQLVCGSFDIDVATLKKLARYVSGCGIYFTWCLSVCLSVCWLIHWGRKSCHCVC